MLEIGATKAVNYFPRLNITDFIDRGHVVRPPDTRTVDQLRQNIDYFAERHIEVAHFKNELKDMNPKYLGLASDICELATHGHKFLLHGIKMQKEESGGINLFQFLMSILPTASKLNPESLDLTKAMIDNTGSGVSEYALNRLHWIFTNKTAAQHMKALTPLVGEIAGATLSGAYTLEDVEEEEFVNALTSFMDPKVSVDKLQLLPTIIGVAKQSKGKCYIDSLDFAKSETPIDTIKLNLAAFPKLNSNFEEDEPINITDFLMGTY